MYYEKLDASALEKEFEAVKAKYLNCKGQNIKLDMSRGKPSPAQLDLSNEIFGLIKPQDNFSGELNLDCRNYGCLEGLPELKKLFARILDMPAEQVFVGGNASLNLMFDVVSQAMATGLGAGAWAKEEKVRFICPCPGYDRHFSICEHFGIEMIPVDNTENGPDMDAVENLVKDPTVRGMWCVPKYSNPQGFVYSDETVRRIANLKPAAKDFRVFWDNAYAIHYLYKDVPLLNIYEECKKAGNEDLVLQFASTSKITFSGAGVAALAASQNNLALLKKRMTVQTIGPDKLNQLRHARMFPTYESLLNHMERHAEILRPKFETVLRIFEERLKPLGIASWTKPQGGYFISLDLLDGCAKRTFELCKEAGLTLTAVGAPFPYKNDPRDRNLRIAPSYPDNAELEKACELLCTCVQYAVLEKMI